MKPLDRLVKAAGKALGVTPTVELERQVLVILGRSGWLTVDEIHKRMPLDMPVTLARLRGTLKKMQRDKNLRASPYGVDEDRQVWSIATDYSPPRK